MKKHFFYFLLIFVISFTNTFSQISEGGIPLSFKSRNLKADVPVYHLPSFDVKYMLAEDELNIKSKAKIPYRFAKEFNVDYNVNNSGVWETLPGGHKVWRISINSDDAFSLNFNLSPFKLPEGAKVFIYNEDKTEVLGDLTSKNNNT